MVEGENVLHYVKWKGNCPAAGNVRGGGICPERICLGGMSGTQSNVRSTSVRILILLI